MKFNLLKMLMKLDKLTRRYERLIHEALRSDVRYYLVSCSLIERGMRVGAEKNFLLSCMHLIVRGAMPTGVLPMSTLGLPNC